VSKFHPLRVALEKDGWEIEQVEPESDDWWSFQIWQLTSLWSPVEFEMRLSFVIDPQMERLLEENVVNLNISNKPLNYYYSDDSESIYLRPWDECLRQTLQYLRAQREAAIQRAPAD